MVSAPPWLIPLAAGLAIGWYFSGTISKFTSSLKLPISGGHVGYSYPGGAEARSVNWPRRSFDKEYPSWLTATVNTIPTQS